MKKILALLPLLFLFACSQQQNKEDTIKIGVFEPLTGLYEESGKEILRGVQLAHKQKQYALDKKIELIAYDTKSLEFEAANAVSYLVGRHHVQALIGSYGVKTMSHALPVIEAAAVPTISSSSTLADIARSQWATSLTMNDVDQATAMAQFAEEILGLRNIAIVVDEEMQHGQVLSYTFANQVSDRVSVHFISYHTGDTTFYSQLRRIKSLSIDGIYCPGDPIASAYLIEAIRQDFPYIPIMGGDRWENPSFYQAGKEDTRGVYFTSHFSRNKLNTAKASQFVSSYKKYYGQEPNSYSALGYDSYNALIYAIDQAQSTNPHKVQHHIRAISKLEGATGLLYADYPPGQLRPIRIMRQEGKKAQWIRTVEVKS